MARIRGVLSFAVLCLVGAWAIGSDYRVTARGSFFCRQGRTSVPLAGARVELMDSDCDGSEICDDVMGRSSIRSDGSFEVSGVGGDIGSWSWSRPDVYVRVLYTDDRGVRVADELDDLRGAHTAKDEHDNVEGSVDIGSWLVGDEGAPVTQCGLFLAAKGSVDSYKALMRADPPAGHYDVLYWSAVFVGTPWTNVDTTHWPTNFPTGSVNDHEFAHSVRHALDGDLTHFAWDTLRFRYARNHSYCDSMHIGETRPNREGFAFNEGWAEYWEGYTSTCPPDSTNMEVEGNVAAALYRLSTCAGVDKAGMVAVLRDGPGAIHSFSEFRARYEARFPACGIGTVAIPVSGRVYTMHPIARQAQVASAQREIARINKGIAELRTQLKSAQSAPAAKATCGPKAECYGVLMARIKPAMLEAHIAQAVLARTHIERSLGSAFEQSLTGALGQAKLETWLGGIRRDYQKQARQIVQSAFRNALRSLDGLPDSNEQVRLFRADLRHKAAELDGVLMKEGALPPQMVPPEGVFSEAVVRRR